MTGMLTTSRRCHKRPQRHGDTEKTTTGKPRHTRRHEDTDPDPKKFRGFRAFVASFFADSSPCLSVSVACTFAPVLRNPRIRAPRATDEYDSCLRSRCRRRAGPAALRHGHRAAGGATEHG